MPDLNSGETPSQTPNTITISEDKLPEPSFLIRATAFTLDYIFLLLLGTLIIVQIIIPTSYSTSTDELLIWINNYSLWIENPVASVMPKPSEVVTATLLLITESFSMIFILYFLICTRFFKGRSIGKKIFNLRTISLTGEAKVSIFHSFLRAFSKTLMLFYFFPCLLIIGFLTKHFHKSKKWGHDLLSQTKVIDEYQFNQMLSSQRDIAL
tara:strand:+ start:29 stop:658 length:630 start_codon:yes stop_codon:yes gene_type:complete